MCSKNRKVVEMNTIQNYGSINLNENYNKQFTNFKSNKFVKPLQSMTSKKAPNILEKAQSKLSERFFTLCEKLFGYGKIFGPTVLEIEPAKNYEELHKIIKNSIRSNKVEDLMLKLTYSLFIPKKMRNSTYNAKEVIDMGYNFAQKNKDKLDVLTYRAKQSGNTDYLKGILKALEEWKIA